MIAVPNQLVKEPPSTSLLAGGWDPVDCPRCGYCLRGLPRHHNCPECGFAYDQDTRIWKQSGARSGMIVIWSMSYLSVLAASGVNLLMLFNNSASGFRHWPEMRTIIVVVSVVWWTLLFLVYASRRRRESFLAVTPDGIVIHASDRWSRMIAWDALVRVELRKAPDQDPTLIILRNQRPILNLSRWLPMPGEAEQFRFAVKTGQERQESQVRKPPISIGAVF